jgi:hypothetical protein
LWRLLLRSRIQDGAEALRGDSAPSAGSAHPEVEQSIARCQSGGTKPGSEVVFPPVEPAEGEDPAAGAPAERPKLVEALEANDDQSHGARSGEP